jgi:hypothetical protein
MLPDTGIDDAKKQRNAEYAKHINDPVLSSLKIEGIHLLFFLSLLPQACVCLHVFQFGIIYDNNLYYLTKQVS